MLRLMQVNGMNYVEWFYVEIFQLDEKALEEGAEVALKFVRKPEEMNARLERVLDEVDLADRMALEMHFRDRMSFRKIAEKLKMSDERARKRAERAIRVIRNAYKGYLCTGVDDFDLSRLGPWYDFRGMPLQRLELTNRDILVLYRADYRELEKLVAVFDEGFQTGLMILESTGVGRPVAERVRKALLEAGIINEYGSIRSKKVQPREGASAQEILLARPIYDYDRLSAHMMTALYSTVCMPTEGVPPIITVGDLVNCFRFSEESGMRILMRVRGIGKKSAGDIYQALVEDGLIG